jgi:very-short-patch-repair endonuclease
MAKIGPLPSPLPQVGEGTNVPLSQLGEGASSNSAPSLAGEETSANTPLPLVGEGQGRGQRTLANAKSLRSNQTEAEARLWYHLRAHRFMGLKFKRQKPVGRYIADFVCWERRLIIELDGGQHAEQVTYDQQRDAWLRSEGYTVLRFWNNDVMHQMDGVLEQIRCVVAREPSPLTPPPARSTPVGAPLLRSDPSAVPQAGEGK